MKYQIEAKNPEKALNMGNKNPVNPFDPDRPRGKKRAIPKEPRAVPPIESVPWLLTREYGEPITITLPRVRFLEDDWPIKEGGKPLRPVRT